jgi:DNA (cytosine-5)-methyltransferase 1
VTRDNGRQRRVISLFSGAGGLDLGLKMAGFEILACIEIDHASCETLRENAVSKRIIEKDIRELDPQEILSDCGLKTGELDLISAGPPCQSFSNIGNRKGLSDPRGQLFDDLLRFVKEMQPQFVLTENVPGMRTLNGGQVVDAVVASFEGLGYRVSVRELNAADYGVPQIRRRLFFVASRDKRVFEYPRPTHTKPPAHGSLKTWRTVGEAFSRLPKDYASRPDNFGMRHSDIMKAKMRMIPPGKNFKILPKDLLPECWKNGKHEGADTFGRLELSKPSVTIRTAAYNPTKGRYIHPLEDRGLTTLEMAALQTFPPKYRYVGSLREVGEQIGNAVPPLLAQALGEQIQRAMKNEAAYVSALDTWQ